MDEKKLKQLIFTQRPVPGQDFDLRISQQAQRLVGETQVMKKKISVLAIVVAVLLSLALFGAVAELLGLNLFELFGKHDQRLAELAPKAILKEVSPITIESPELGTTTAGINSAYYDGQSLVVAYAIKNGRYMEEFTPDKEQLAGMEKDNNPLMMAVSDPENEGLLLKWNEAAAAGKPFGYMQVSITPSDHTRTRDGTDLPPDSSAHQPGPDGEIFTINDYESPLPEEAQNLDALNIEIGLFKLIQYRYFDGQQSYTGFESQKLEPMRATVWRTDADIRRFQGQGTFAGVPLKASVTASATSAQVTLKTIGAIFPALPEDVWYSVYLRDGNQTELRPLDGTSGGTDLIVFNFHGTGQAPDQLEMQLRIDAESDVKLEQLNTEPVFITLVQE